MSTKHKSINPDTIDFDSTSLASNYRGCNLDNADCVFEDDSIEWYYTTGELCTSLLVSTVLKWIEAKNIHVPEDMLPHECDSLKWLDDNFESATRDYFMDVYAVESEVHCG